MQKPPALCARMLRSSLHPTAAHCFSLTASAYKVLSSEQVALGANMSDEVSSSA
jgi:hypothetical protein